jgi:hypothetical protein
MHLNITDICIRVINKAIEHILNEYLRFRHDFFETVNYLFYNLINIYLVIKILKNCVSGARNLTTATSNAVIWDILCFPVLHF